MRFIISSLLFSSFIFSSSSAIAACSGSDIAPNSNGIGWFLSLVKTSPNPSDSRQVSFSATKYGQITNSTNITGLTNNTIVNVYVNASSVVIDGDCTLTINLSENPNSPNASKVIIFTGSGSLSADKKSLMGVYQIYNGQDTLEMGTMIGMKN